ncbi:MAG: hypothetical protein AVO34_05105 [Firmicutes bacterium ML8_F2]|nr:MAG: hypothetical protein AVO34_05105 [Firmicutes bacterium ML8_F2]
MTSLKGAYPSCRRKAAEVPGVSPGPELSRRRHRRILPESAALALRAPCKGRPRTAERPGGFKQPLGERGSEAVHKPEITLATGTITGWGRPRHALF